MVIKIEVVMKTQKIKTVVVDDSYFMVTILSDILEEDDMIEVVGKGKNGEEAIKLNKDMDPDVILLDIDMPVMDGLTALQKIMSDDPTPVIVISGLDDKKTNMSVKALTNGAVDYIKKTSGSLSLDIRKESDKIINKVKKAARAGVKAREEVEGGRRFKPLRGEDHIVTIAASTGGIRAIEELLSPLPKNFPVTIIVVQHIAPEFSAHLASTLDTMLDLDVKEAEDDEELKKGIVYIIPAGKHGEIKEQHHKKYISLNTKPKLNSVRPSANYLFQSAAKVYGEKVVGIVLSGMGKDGTEGAQSIKKEGGFLAVQERESCVVYGMPKNVKNTAGADFEERPSKIGKKILEMFMERID